MIAAIVLSSPCMSSDLRQTAIQCTFTHKYTQDEFSRFAISSVFSARRQTTLLLNGHSVVRLSICLSHWQTMTKWFKVSKCVLYLTTEWCRSFLDANFVVVCLGIRTQRNVIKKGTPSQQRSFDQYAATTRKRCDMRYITYCYSLTERRIRAFWLVTKSVTVTDLERRKSRYFVSQTLLDALSLRELSLLLTWV